MTDLIREGRLTCPECGNYWDTPGHEYGCKLGRISYGHEDWYPEYEEEDEDSDDLYPR